MVELSLASQEVASSSLSRGSIYSPGYDVKLCPAVLPLLLSVGRLDDRKGIRSIKKSGSKILTVYGAFECHPLLAHLVNGAFGCHLLLAHLVNGAYGVPPDASSFRQ